MVVKLPDACLQVKDALQSSSKEDATCPNCNKKLTVPLTPAKIDHTPVTPLTPPFHQSTYFSQSPIYTTTSLLEFNEELIRLNETLKALRLSGWYYGNLDWQGAQNLLKDASIGAFVVRDSGDKNFVFSLSMQTEKGPKSVRLKYEKQCFRLDCAKPLARYMPRFRSVMDLVLHYIQEGQSSTVWVDLKGCPHSPILLNTPLRQSPPTLLHSARLVIHKTLDSNPITPKLWCAPKYRFLALPSTLIKYLGEYPYSI